MSCAKRKFMHRGDRCRWNTEVMAVLFAVLVAMPAGCEGPSLIPEGPIPPYDGDYPYRIVTTCGMATDVVTIVAGDRAEIHGLMGFGVDPHLYKPTRNDVKVLSEADIVFYVGLGLEGRMADTLQGVARRGTPTIPLGERVSESFLLALDDGQWDPHLWMDVGAWSQVVGIVARTLAEFDPAGAEVYAANAAAYREELAVLDDYVRRTIDSIPRETRYLITAHDAFGYFSRAYDIPVRAVQGISTESEAGVDDVNRLIDFIVEERVPAVFMETSVAERAVRAVVEGAHRRGWDVSIGGDLFSDAMGPPGSFEGTYVGMIDHNATTIARALGGEAPAAGLHGKLSP